MFHSQVFVIITFNILFFSLSSSLSEDSLYSNDEVQDDDKSIPKNNTCALIALKLKENEL